MKSALVVVFLVALVAPRIGFAQISDGQIFRSSKIQMKVIDVVPAEVTVKLKQLASGEEKTLDLHRENLAGTRNSRLTYDNKETNQVIIAYYIQQQRPTLVVFQSSGNPCHPEDDILELAP